ncbi:unnamed protein product [Schistocephalus solidus]|uniref:MAGUK p55 subfamily member 2 n=1 Tax=Schistocephalus solidus TaxID=70667 RepID=A0A183SM82_SCHSO|nr:unnamed protein product [Schistocephalus solidus]
MEFESLTAWTRFKYNQRSNRLNYEVSQEPMYIFKAVDSICCSGLDALRKAKKNIRRVFNAPEDFNECQELHSFLSSKGFKVLIALYSTLEEASDFYADEEDQDALDLIADVENDLQMLTDCSEVDSESRDELLEILRNCHVQALGRCLSEIASGNFYTPSLPSSGLFAIEGVGPTATTKLGTSNSLPPISSSTIGTTEKLYSPRTYASVNQLKTASGNSLSGTSGLNGVAILTGGGEGLPMKPVEGTVKIISFVSAGGSLGITVGIQDYESANAGYVREIYVKRVMAGSQIERQGLLHEGDIIREVNGVPIDSPETLQDQIAKSPSTVTMKILPAYKDPKPKSQTKVIFKASEAGEFAFKDVMVYEEVALISGFQRPVICLIGATGVGRQTLRDMLIERDPDRYEIAIPYTSRPKFPDEEEGEEFFFESAARMQNTYKKNGFIEFGEFEGHFFGTKLKTIRRIVHSGKTCLLDCNPSAIQLIRTAEFMPYVVFLAAPSVSCMKAMYEYGRSMGFCETWKRDEDFRRTLDHSREIERDYRHLFDKIFICDNIEVTFDALRRHLDSLLTEPQWVPAKWLY